MPQQSIFDLDGRQEIEKQNCALEDELCIANNKLSTLSSLEDKVDALEKEVEEWKDKWKEMQRELKRLSYYDLDPGGCDESTCNAKITMQKHGDYLVASEVERICEI
jgi:predicted nuclease with TOPRIM domain